MENVNGGEIEKLSSKFTDLKGREWDCALNVLTVERVRKEVDADFYKVDDTPDLVERIEGDDIYCGSVVCCVIAPQLEAKSVSLEDFADSIAAGNALDDAALALENAIVNFTRSPRRKMVAGLMDAARRMIRKGAKLGETKMDSGILDRIADRELKKAETEIDAM